MSGRSVGAVVLVLATLIPAAGCTINEDGPATPGSAAATELEAVERVSTQAQEIEALATRLEAMTDAAREAAPGAPREAIIQEMRALMAELKTRNEALQSEVKQMEDRVHTASGDPAWPIPAEEDEDGR